MLEELKEDINQFNDTLEDFYHLEQEDIEGAYSLAMIFMQLTSRWSEIQLNSAKYCTSMNVSRTSFRDYAYEKYRIASKCHEFCRVVWRQGKEEYKNGFQNEM